MVSLVSIAYLRAFGDERLGFGGRGWRGKDFGLWRLQVGGGQGQRFCPLHSLESVLMSPQQRSTGAPPMLCHQAPWHNKLTPALHHANRRAWRRAPAAVTHTHTCVREFTGCTGVFKGVQSSRLGAEGAPSAAACSAGAVGAICCAGVSAREHGDSAWQPAAGLTCAC